MSVAKNRLSDVHRNGCLLLYASVWWCLARCRAGVGPVPAPKHARMVPSWLEPCGVRIVRHKQVVPIYASLAKETASTLPGPFLETAFFFGRGLMTLIAEASSCVFKCAA